MPRPLSNRLPVERNLPANAPSSADFRREIGQYFLRNKLGQGGMGEVYKAYHVRLKREVAIKFLLPAVSTRRGLQRFLQEMESLGQLDHPNILRATDAGEWRGRHYLVTEYLDGLNLADLVQTAGPLSPGNACELIRQAANGLQHAHEKNMVHRDIKPGNLFLTRQGVVKVLDLGLARLQGDSADTGITRPGEVMGTYDYMAPEQIDDSRTVDIRADLYSLGCTFYFLLTGKPVFPKMTKEQKILAHANTAPPSIAASRSEVPQSVIEVVERLLAKKPEDRFPTPAALLMALEPWKGEHDLGPLCLAMPSPSAEPVSLASQAESYREASTALSNELPPAAAPRRQRPRGVLPAAGVLVLVALGVGAYYGAPYLTERPEHLEPPAATPDEKAPPKQVPPPKQDPPGVDDPWDLLARPPLLVLKPQGAFKFEYQPKERTLHFDSLQVCLFQLGVAEEADYEFEVVFFKNPSVGQVGVFFGRQEKDDVARFLTFTFRQAKNQFVLDLERNEVKNQSLMRNGLAQVRQPAVANPQEHRLTVQVRGRKLTRLLLNQRELAVPAQPTENELNGAFGVYGSGGSTYVTSARRMPVPGK